MPRVKRPASFESGASKKPKSPVAPFKDLLDDLDNLQDDDETRLLVTAFVKLPSKKLYPDYYTLIEEPISLNEISKKVARDAYSSADEFVADFRLMHDNAVKYNDPNSWIVEDAAKLLAYVEEHAPEVTLTGDSEPETTDLPKVCLDVLEDVIGHDFPGEGQLSGPFMDDIDPEEYPDYFQLIANPTSFTNVRAKVTSGDLFSEEKSVLENLQAFYDATMLIFSNAQTYNDPSSLIHEDSEKLRSVFSEKFAALKNALVADSKPGLKLTLKAPKEPVKLKLNLKGKTPGAPAAVGAAAGAATSALNPDEPPKKRRGRKPKKLIEEEQRLAALEAARLKQESGEVDEETAAADEDADDSETFDPSESCAMGKSKTIPSSDDVFIRRVAFVSSQSSASQIMDSLASQPPQQLSRAQLFKKSLYPEVPVLNAATFFEYQFEPLGYSTKAYSITLPRDSTPIVNFKVGLHELIYNIKRDDLIDGQGLLKGKAEEDFMCSLSLNDEEIDNGCEMTEEVDPVDNETKLLNLTYELKLNYGLNMINFELRLSPSLSKSLKKKSTEEEPTAIAGRHTRHQMQQIKLNWDVEKFTLFVVSHGA
ncbi:hypothetical protein JCM33374_g1745 [Metschnikowia sp. JCM 33374]|nr:hypothetical protein JCM33374_g1745 [Metschnikowia sp. JCM 33374]